MEEILERKMATMRKTPLLMRLSRLWKTIKEIPVMDPSFPDLLDACKGLEARVWDHLHSLERPVQTEDLLLFSLSHFPRIYLNLKSGDLSVDIDMEPIDKVLIISGDSDQEVYTMIIKIAAEFDSKRKKNCKPMDFKLDDQDFHVFEHCDAFDMKRLEDCLPFNNDAPLFSRSLVIHAWKACERWSFDYLVGVMGHRLVPVEVGGKYTDFGWTQKLMTFSEFVTGSGHQPYYLAQHNLFRQIPVLKQDIDLGIFRPFIGAVAAGLDLNVWIGGAQTVTPLHHDPNDNFFVQIRGVKRVTLISPKDSVNLYPHPAASKMSNTSQIDLTLDAETIAARYPLFQNITKIRRILVRAGDVLFVPRGWWHFVESLTPSISISCWVNH